MTCTWITGGDSMSNVKTLKETFFQIFKKAGFDLHKWHSNCDRLEEIDPSHKLTEETYEIQQLGVKTEETKKLGIRWDKQ